MTVRSLVVVASAVMGGKVGANTCLGVRETDTRKASKSAISSFDRSSGLMRGDNGGGSRTMPHTAVKSYTVVIQPQNAGKIRE